MKRLVFESISAEEDEYDLRSEETKMKEAIEDLLPWPYSEELIKFLLAKVEEKKHW